MKCSSERQSRWGMEAMFKLLMCGIKWGTYELERWLSAPPMQATGTTTSSSNRAAGPNCSTSPSAWSATASASVKAKEWDTSLHLPFNSCVSCYLLFPGGEQSQVQRHWHVHVWDLRVSERPLRQGVWVRQSRHQRRRLPSTVQAVRLQHAHVMFIFCAVDGYSKLVTRLLEERTRRSRVTDTASACVACVSARTLVSSVNTVSATRSTATTTREDCATVRSHLSNNSRSPNFFYRTWIL